MGKTRTRVTFLVLSLESIGFLMLALALYLAGGVQMQCNKSAGSPAEVSCRATQKRGFGLIGLHDRRYSPVTGASTLRPALGRSEFWLSLETPDRTERVMAGTRARTEREVEALNTWLTSSSRDPFELRRSTTLWAVGTAFFGCIWIFVISLIMREFLGYHTPWWLRALNRQE